MVVVALGSNLAGGYGSSEALLEAALARFPTVGLKILKRSSWWRSAAWPDPMGPEYRNGVALVEAQGGPIQVLRALLDIETELGRERSARNAPRTLDLDLIAHLQHFARVVDAMPCQLGNMDQTISAAQIDECAEITQPRDDALADFALVELVEQHFLARFAVAALGVTLAEDQAAALAVDLDHLQVDLLTDHAHHAQLAVFFVQAARQVEHMRRRDEAAQVAEWHDQTALVGVGDDAFPDTFGLQQLFRLLPVFGLLRLRDGEDEVALFIFHADDHHVDLVADMEVLFFHAHAVEVAPLNDAIALQPVDADDQALPIDREDDAGDDIATLRLLLSERLFEERGEIEIANSRAGGDRCKFHCPCSP